jgi:hypothetical protein
MQSVSSQRQSDIGHKALWPSSIKVSNKFICPAPYTVHHVECEAVATSFV